MSVHNIYSFYSSESSESETEEMVEIDIETLTMEQYLGKDENAYEHVEKVLEITNLFNILGISKDAIMLQVFPFTLTSAAKRWMGRVPVGTVNTWDLLKKAFILKYCLPSRTTNQLEDIRNFRQGNETFYQA
ncbi:zinc knuckle CX2CX4HX4C containing protein [Tanacetum coccineum]